MTSASTAWSDDDAPRQPARHLTLGQDLRHISIGELREYTARLRSEITRVEAQIEAKQGAMSAADALFKKPQGG